MTTAGVSKARRFLGLVAAGLAAGGFAAALLVAIAPYVGLGEAERFVLYELWGWTRRTLFYAALYIGAAGAAVLMVLQTYQYMAATVACATNAIVNSVSSIVNCITPPPHNCHVTETSTFAGNGTRIRRGLIVSSAVLLTVVLPSGIMLAGAEYWIRLRHERQNVMAQGIVLDSEVAYDTPGQTKSKSPGMSQMAYHYFAGYIPLANISASGYRTDNGYRNNNGNFRYDEDFPREKPSGEVRVFVTGGSAAWGAGVNQDQLYTTIVERMFAKRYDVKVRVVCAAVAAYTSTQERIFLENHILDFVPDVVVMFSGWNDTYYTNGHWR